MTIVSPRPDPNKKLAGSVGEFLRRGLLRRIAASIVLFALRVEMRFAHLKIYHGFAAAEGSPVRAANISRRSFIQNLKTLALRSIGPPPHPRSHLHPLLLGSKGT